jgi:hypothetical protein
VGRKKVKRKEKILLWKQWNYEKKLKEKETRKSLWRVGPLLGNDRETNNKKIAVTR